MADRAPQEFGHDAMGRPMSVRIYWKLLGAHYHVRLFSGPGDGKRGCLGNLTMRQEDFDALNAVLLSGSEQTGIDVQIEKEPPRGAVLGVRRS